MAQVQSLSAPSLCKDSRGPGLPSAQCRAGCGHSVPFLETVPRSSSRRELPSKVSPGALCCLTPPRPKNRHVIQVWPIRTPGSPGLSDWRPQPANGKRWGHVGFPTELLRGSPSCCRRGEPPSGCPALRTAEPQGGWSPGPAWAGSEASWTPSHSTSLSSGCVGQFVGVLGTANAPSCQFPRRTGHQIHGAPAEAPSPVFTPQESDH